MKRIFEIKEERTLIEAISVNIAGLGRPAIKLLLKSGEIKVNGQKQTVDSKLKAGDTVFVFLPQKYEAAPVPETVYADENILIMDKPPRYDVENNLLGFVKKTYPTALAVHRLDRGTSGLVVFALTQAAFDALSAAFKEKSLSKVYYAEVSGQVKKQGLFKAYLFKDAEKSEVKIFDTPKAGCKKIETQIEVINAEKEKSLLKINLLTGRTHQIRAHLAHLGHPILGDNKYGFDKGLNENSIIEDAGKGIYALCAAEIRFLSLKQPLEYLNGRVFLSPSKYLLTKKSK